MTSKATKTAGIVISPDNEDKPTSWNVLKDGVEIGYILQRNTHAGKEAIFTPSEGADVKLNCTDLKILLETMTEIQNNAIRSMKSE